MLNNFTINKLYEAWQKVEYSPPIRITLIGRTSELEKLRSAVQSYSLTHRMDYTWDTFDVKESEFVPPDKIFVSIENKHKFGAFELPKVYIIDLSSW